MDIRLDKASKIPLYRQIASQMRRQILSGEIGAGSRLPSERAMAQILGVHRNTVVKAYSELKDSQLIASRQGACYEVALPAAGRRAKNADQKTKQVHWPSQIKEEYLDMEVTFDDLFQRFRREDGISLGSGIASPDIYDKETVAADLAGLLTEEGKEQYFYSPYQGDPTLRQRLASFLSAKGVKATAGEIQILTETNQALDFLVMLLVRPGDTVIVEEPVSPDVYRCMELAGAKMVTVPVEGDGISGRQLDALLVQYKPRLLYVNSSFHDPTGAILSMERRQEIIEVAARRGVPIIEEDAASELVYEGPRLLPMKAYDRLHNVIYIFSFSLTFMPGLSLAFVAADRQLIRSLSYLVSVRMVATDWLTQKLISRYLGDGSYYAAVERFRQDYMAKQALLCRKLDEMRPLGVDYERPRGGVYIWCKLPPGLDAAAVTEAAHRRGVSVIPGHVFYPFRNGGRDHIRLNYSYEDAGRLAQGMDLLREVLEEELAALPAGELAHKK